MFIKKIDFEKLGEFIKQNKDQYIDLVCYGTNKICTKDSYIWLEEEFNALIRNYNDSFKFNIKIKVIDYVNQNSKINQIDIEHFYLIKLRNVFYLIPYEVCEIYYDENIKSYGEKNDVFGLLNCNSDITKHKTEIKEIKEKTESEIKELNAQLEKIQLDIENKKKMLEEKIDQLKDKIFIINSRLLKFKTLFGQTFEIYHLRKGEKSSKDIPLIIYQKFRFLDEEMIRMSNMEYENWCVNYDNINEFFSKNDYAFNTFCPVDKCITVFRNCSERYASLKDVYGKLLEEIEFWRANQIGILIRDGENLYLIWVDEEITIKNNLFMSNQQITNDDTIDLSLGLRRYETVVYRNRELLLLIINILVLKEKLIELQNIDEKTDILNCSSIIFSSADNFINDNRFPSLSDFIRNSDVRKNDLIFTLKYINGERWDSWLGRYTDKSYGYYNRGYGSSIDYSSVIPISIKENDRYYVKAITKKWSRRKQDYNTRGVNIEIYKEEFIPLKDLTLEMVNYWIDSKNVGNYKYVDVINRLKDLKDYLIKNHK